MTSKTYKDFVLSRIGKVRHGTQEAPQIPVDKEWLEIRTLTIRPHHRLGSAQKKAIELDFGMHGGLVLFPVRDAMSGYTKAYLEQLRDSRGPLLDVSLS